MESVKLKFISPKKKGGLVFARLSGYNIIFSNGARREFSDFLEEDERYIVATNEDESDKRIFISRSLNFPNQPAFDMKLYGGNYQLNCRNLLRELGLNSFSGFRAKVWMEVIEGKDFVIIDPEIKLSK